MFSFFYRLFDRLISTPEKQIPTNPDKPKKKTKDDEDKMRKFHSKKIDDREIFPLNSFQSYLSFFAFEPSYRNFVITHDQKNKIKTAL